MNYSNLAVSNICCIVRIVKGAIELDNSAGVLGIFNNILSDYEVATLCVPFSPGRNGVLCVVLFSVLCSFVLFVLSFYS